MWKKSQWCSYHSGSPVDCSWVSWCWSVSWSGRNGAWLCIPPSPTGSTQPEWSVLPKPRCPSSGLKTGEIKIMTGITSASAGRVQRGRPSHSSMWKLSGQQVPAVRPCEHGPHAGPITHTQPSTPGGASACRSAPSHLSLQQNRWISEPQPGTW